MVDSRRTTICERCRNEVPVSSLRYVPRGSDSEVALCPQCVERAYSHSTGHSNPAGRTPLKSSAGKPKFLCKRCNFKFTIPPGVEEAECPFCGRKDRIESYGANYAEKLVQDSSY